MKDFVIDYAPRGAMIAFEGDRFAMLGKLARRGRADDMEPVSLTAVGRGVLGVVRRVPDCVEPSNERGHAVCVVDLDCRPYPAEWRLICEANAKANATPTLDHMTRQCGNTLRQMQFAPWNGTYVACGSVRYYEALAKFIGRTDLTVRGSDIILPRNVHRLRGLSPYMVEIDHAVSLTPEMKEGLREVRAWR